MTSTSGTISGSGIVTISDMIIDGSASYTNTGTVIITDELRGTGTFTNGNGGGLELQAAGPFSISTLDASTNANTVTYSSGNSVEINATTYHNLVINKTGGTADNGAVVTINNDFTITLGTFDINENLVVSGDINVNAGLLEHNAATLTLSGDLNINGGEYSPNNSSAVSNVSQDLNLITGTYDHNNGDVNILGDLIITGGTMDFDGASSVLDVTDVTISTGSATWDTGTINVTNASGGVTVNSGTLDMNGASVNITSTYDINGGTNDLDGGNLTVANIDIESSDLFTVSNATLNSTSSTLINGTLTFDNGTGVYNLNDITINSGGSWNVTAASDFTISGNISHNGASFNACSASGCDYTLTSTSGTIGGTSSITITDIIINGSASYTNTGTLSATDRLTGTGSFINGASASFSYSGNNSAGANFDITNFTASATGNTVAYSRAGDMQLRTTTDAGNNYYNLVANTGAAGDDLTLVADITIDNQLTLTVGDLILGTNNLIMADGTIMSGGSTSSYVQITSTGILRQNYSTAGSNLNFQLGDNNDYSPITSFTINSATFGAGAYLDLTVTDANNPNRDIDNTASGGDDDGIPAVDYISRYWDLSANNITNVNYDATYVYVDADVVGTTEGNMIGTVYRTPPGFGFNDWGVFGTVDPLTNTVTVSNVDGFGTLFAMDNTSNRLPIVLISFEARASGSKVLLNWSTAAEINNNFFTIQRSQDASNWQDIITVDGAGNSDGILNYNVNDNFPLGGRSFYRLKQTDFDGSFTYSEVGSVLVADEITPELFLYPNPVSSGDLVNISLSSDVSESSVMRLMNMKGEVLMEKELNTSQKRVATSGLQKGVYLVVIRNSTGVFKKKLVIN